MDPNANLQEIREILKERNDNDLFGAFDAERLADLIEALDGWLVKGGALPKAWRR